MFKWLFRKKPMEIPVGDPVNKDYICLTTDPATTINDLRKGEWNMDKVKQGLYTGMLRYAKQSEVDAAQQAGTIK